MKRVLVALLLFANDPARSGAAQPAPPSADVQSLLDARAATIPGAVLRPRSSIMKADDVPGRFEWNGAATRCTDALRNRFGDEDVHRNGARPDGAGGRGQPLGTPLQSIFRHRFTCRPGMASRLRS